MRVAVDRVEGVVASVSLLDSAGAPVAEVDQFLAFVLASGGSPNTALAYGYDLRYLFEFLDEGGLDWKEFGPAMPATLVDRHANQFQTNAPSSGSQLAHISLNTRRKTRSPDRALPREPRRCPPARSDGASACPLTNRSPYQQPSARSGPPWRNEDGRAAHAC